MAGRRMGPPDASIRFTLLDTTERVIARDGYPAVSSRSVGAEAGVDQKLVYYYFRNMEELVVATFHRRSQTFLATLRELAAASPLKALWELSSHRSGRLMIEFMAMATHTPALRDEVARYSDAATGIVEELLSANLPNARPGLEIFTPAFTSFLLASLARNFILESELGLLRNPRETETFILDFLDYISR